MLLAPLRFCLFPMPYAPCPIPYHKAPFLHHANYLPYYLSRSLKVSPLCNKKEIGVDQWFLESIEGKRSCVPNAGFRLSGEVTEKSNQLCPTGLMVFACPENSRDRRKNTYLRVLCVSAVKKICQSNGLQATINGYSFRCYPAGSGQLSPLY